MPSSPSVFRVKKMRSDVQRTHRDLLHSDAGADAAISASQAQAAQHNPAGLRIDDDGADGGSERATVRPLHFDGWSGPMSDLDA
eukprot:3088624-Prymnesium_polylepis.1